MLYGKLVNFLFNGREENHLLLIKTTLLDKLFESNN
jgi:hypothetical protein